MTSSASEILARYLSETTFERLPAAVVTQVRHCLLDSIGVAIAGRDARAARAARCVALQLGGAEEATLWGHGRRVAGVNAAMANGVLAHSLDFNDDIAGVQAGAIVAPLALTLGEALRRSGREVIVAMAAGYDVAVRVALSIQSQSLYGRGFQPTAVCGVFAAAAVAGRLLRLTPETMAHALGIAGSSAGGTVEFLAEGADTKAYHPGKAVHAGAVAALLAAAGMTGPRRIFEGAAGLLRTVRDGGRPECLTEALGERYDILSTSVKSYPCADGNAAPLEAAAAILREQSLAPRDIDRLRFQVKSFLIPFALRYNGDSTRRYRPANELDARMSLPYCVAAGLLNGGALGVDDFEPTRIERPEVQALADRIDAVGDEGLDRMPFLPMSMPAIATLTTRDGRTFVRRVDYQRGDPRNPFSAADFERKFRTAATALPPGRVERLLSRIHELESLADVGVLAAHLGATDGPSRCDPT